MVMMVANVLFSVLGDTCKSSLYFQPKYTLWKFILFSQGDRFVGIRKGKGIMKRTMQQIMSFLFF
jgi:hypothetical protein